MVFSAKWQVCPSLSWQSAVSRLERTLENSGCAIYGSGPNREVCIPGLDERVLSHLRGDEGPDEGLLSDDWTKFIQRELWGRAEIRFNAESRTVEYRWTYWTTFQIALHLVTVALFFGTGCRVEWTWLLLVPMLFSMSDALKLNQLFSAWHTKCSLG